MSQPGYFEPELVSVKAAGLDEKWVQSRVAGNPKLLGLGDLVLKDRERVQPGAGRLDLLLQDPESGRRYEVELQLGRTDESHIIRTIEYWDLERKRYPNIDHCAVIVAEEITARFLNVVSLFNGFIPLIALRMQAIRVNGNVGLVFTKVLDEVKLGPDDEQVESEATDRQFWETTGSAKTVRIADQLLQLILSFASGYTLKYNKHYIGPAKDGEGDLFVHFVPRKNALNISLKLPRSDEVTARIEEAGLELLSYNAYFGYYQIRLSAEDVDRHREFLTGIMREAYELRHGAAA